MYAPGALGASDKLLCHLIGNQCHGVFVPWLEGKEKGSQTFLDVMDRPCVKNVSEFVWLGFSYDRPFVKPGENCVSSVTRPDLKRETCYVCSWQTIVSFDW